MQKRTGGTEAYPGTRSGMRNLCRIINEEKGDILRTTLGGGGQEGTYKGPGTEEVPVVEEEVCRGTVLLLPVEHGSPGAHHGPHRPAREGWEVNKRECGTRV